MSHVIRPMAPYRVVISRALTGICLLFLIWRGCSGLLPFQLARPVLTSFHYDITQWLYKLSGLYYLVAQQPVTSAVFTLLVFVTGILSFCFPLQRRFTIPFTLLFFILSVNFNFYLTHNSHYLAGFVWLLFCLWPRKDQHFALLWDGMRYFACWAYGSAFIWKVLYGAFFQWDAGLLSCRGNLAGYLYQNPETNMAHFYYWIMAHPAVLNIGHKIVCLAEGVFLVGFFTKKMDGLLIAMVLLIHGSTSVFSDVFFAELMILALTFVSPAVWQRIWWKTVPSGVRHLHQKIS